MTWLSWFPDTAWKGGLLLATAMIAARLLQKQPAALRHLVWTAALGGLLAMPVLSATTPVRFALLAPEVAAPPSTSPLNEGPLTPRAALGEPSQSARTKEMRSTRTQETQSTRTDETQSTRTATDALASQPAGTAPRVTSLLPSWSVAEWLIAVWFVGVLALGARFLAGVLATRRLGRVAHDADDPLQSALKSAAHRTGLAVAPKLVVTDAITMPCAFGWRRPVIVLPSAARAWSRDRLDVVLLHEAAHIRRGDYVTHLVAEFARIVHWYNPLVWFASRSLRAEAERATDERVINAGATASDYAGHLLEIVTGAGVQRVPAPLLPLAMRSEFEGRLIAILEYAGSRRLRAGAAALTLVLAVGMVGTVASIGAAEPPGSAPDLSISALGGSDTDTSSDTDKSNETREVEAVPPASRRQSAQQASDASSTVSSLIAAINDPVASVRLAVVNALHDSRDTVVVRALMRVLREDESAEVRRAAASALGDIGDTLALSALTEALRRDADIEVRRSSASALGSLEDERGAAALAEALDADADMQVRIEAAQALGQIEGQAAANALTRALGRASDPALKIAVIEAIDSHDDDRNAGALSAALRDANPGVRRAAAEALNGMEDRSIIPALIAAARDEDVEVRRAVIDALADFDDSRNVDVFAAALADRDPEIRSAAAEGLGNIEGLRTAPRPLIAALDDANAEVRHQAAHALGHIRDPASLSALVARVTDSDADVRIGVVEALSEFLDASSTAALQRALRDSNADVREAAANALGDRKRR